MQKAPPNPRFSEVKSLDEFTVFKFANASFIFFFSSCYERETCVGKKHLLGVGPRRSQGGHPNGWLLQSTLQESSLTSSSKEFPLQACRTSRAVHVLITELSMQLF